MRSPRRAIPWLAAPLLAAALLVACSNQQAPPRSPFGDGTGAPTVSASASPTPAPTATPTPSPTPTSSPVATVVPTPIGTAAAVDRELAIGKAIEQLAQWLGVEQASFNLQSFDAQSFPDSCLGVERPGIACASAVTPGARVILRDALDHAHDVRMDAVMRRFAWAPQHTARGTVTAIDQAASTLVLDTGSTQLTLRRVPGTLEATQYASVRPGDQLAVGYDGGPLKQGDLVLVWMATP